MLKEPKPKSNTDPKSNTNSVPNTKPETKQETI